MRFIILVSLLVLLGSMAFALEQVSTERDFVENVEAHEEFSVTIHVNVNEANKPVSMIISEVYPEGFTVVDAGSAIHDEDKNMLKWLFAPISGYLPIQDTDLTYRLKAPGDSGKYVFNGIVNIGAETTDQVGGKITITVGCLENWECSEWSQCENSMQSRTCTDLNNCGTDEDMPIIIRECESSESTPEPEPQPQPTPEPTPEPTPKPSPGPQPENQEPEAYFTWSPNVPVAGNVISFDASSSRDPDGHIVQYNWDFGDGTNASETDPKTEQEYIDSGIYVVVLTVTDNDGLTNTYRETITVSEPEPEQEPQPQPTPEPEPQDKGNITGSFLLQAANVGLIIVLLIIIFALAVNFSKMRKVEDSRAPWQASIRKKYPFQR